MLARSTCLALSRGWLEPVRGGGPLYGNAIMWPGLLDAVPQAVSPAELEELAFHLEDSASFRAFARLPWAWSPKKPVLHKTIGAIRAETWEAVNRTLLASAREGKIEDGSVVRLDSTALILSLSKDGGAAASAQRQ